MIPPALNIKKQLVQLVLLTYIFKEISGSYRTREKKNRIWKFHMLRFLASAVQIAKPAIGQNLQPPGAFAVCFHACEPS
jgi:hypothetical protein